MLHLDDQFDARALSLALPLHATSLKRVQLVAYHLNLPLVCQQLLGTDGARVLMLDQRHLQLVEETDLHFCRDLSVIVADAR